MPWFDGAKLDDIVDYFTFVIVPVVFLYQLRLLPAHGTLFFVALPLLASAYGFCQAAAKTPDFFFTGFPSYWNIVALYLYAGQTPLWLNGALICVLSLFVFIPIRYIYPTRTVRFRRLTNLLGGLWVGVLLVLQPDASQATAFGAGVSVILLRRPAPPTARAACIAVVLALIAAAWLRPDPLGPVAEVEGIIGLAARWSPLAALLAVVALAGVVISPLLAGSAEDAPLRTASCGQPSTP